MARVVLRLLIGAGVCSFTVLLFLVILITRTEQDRTAVITNDNVILGAVRTKSTELEEETTASKTVAISTESPTSHVIITDANKNNTPHFSSDDGWKDEFCNNFLSNRFSIKMTPCGDDSNRVVCHGSPYDNKMGSCALTNVAIDPVRFYEVMDEHRDKVVESNALWLLWYANVNPCPAQSFSGMEKHMVGGDYVKHVTKTAILSTPKGHCTEYVNGTTFMFMGFDYHIYFKFLSWFSLYNGIMNYWEETQQKPTAIIRIPEGHGPFRFSEFEAPLFPEITTVTSFDHLSSVKKGVMCFEKIVLTPWAYSTNAFRCKMGDAVNTLRSKCYGCKGEGLTGTRFATFRRRVLAACGLRDEDPKPVRKSVVLILRKAYHRYTGDRAQKFSRILEDSDGIIASIKTNFPSIVLHVMYLEDVELCDQIRLIHNCDVLMGVHGAGLVHLWWLRKEAAVLEITPKSQTSNPTFKMLSTLVGQQYHGYAKVGGNEKLVKIDTTEIVNELKKYLS